MIDSRGKGILGVARSMQIKKLLVKRRESKAMPIILSKQINARG